MADATRELQIVIRARDEATKVIQGMSGKLSGLVDNVQKSALMFAGLGAATSVAAKRLVDAAGDMQATRTSFTTLIGDAEKAKQTLDSLFQLEQQTPLDLPEILEGSKRLLAMGTAADKLVPTFRMLGDVAAGVGKEKLPQLILAFGQIQSRGKLMGTELRQLTEAGFNLADAMGVSTSKLDEMVSQGEVSFEMVRQGFEKATSEGGRFHGLMDQLAQTTPGRLSTLESSIFKLQVALGEALLPAVNKIIDALIPAIEAFARWAQEHQNLVAIGITAALVLGAIGAAIIALIPIIAGITATFSALSIVLGGVISVIGVIIAILGGPLTLIIGLVIALVAGLALAWKNNWFGIQEKTKAVVDWFQNTAWPAIQGFFAKIKDGVMSVANFFIDKFNAIRGAIEGAINKLAEFMGKKDQAKAFGGGGGGSFQHGGFVPGSYNEAVPVTLHGGERIVPRNGTDVNPGMGGGGGVTINISGSFNLDSDGRVQELADKIISMLGRQNELASKGYSF